MSKCMAYPKIRKALREYLSGAELSTAVWQKRPWTMVHVTVKFDGRTWRDFGFSKANWPDTWDGKRGAALATNKAIADIARKIVRSELNNGHLGECSEWFIKCAESQEESFSVLTALGC